jgi:hypothetical protein
MLAVGDASGNESYAEHLSTLYGVIICEHNDTP